MTAAASVSTSAFAYHNYRLYWLSRLLTSLGMHIVSVAVGWQVYDLTSSTFALGLVGLIQFLPALLLVLFTGAASDRFNRRAIMMVCGLIESFCAAGLLLLAYFANLDVLPIFLVLAVFGTARAFFTPASSSLVTALVPPPALANAITWVSSAWQAAAITGPIAGGFLYDANPMLAYGTAAALAATAPVLLLFVRERPREGSRRATSWSELTAGVQYILREKVVLGAISLDLFAVLLGGATALLPAIARDILHVEASGLGMLRAAPGIGAIAVALLLSALPIRDNAGRIMFVCVALFGAATVLFGLSYTLWVSLVALFLMGATDMVSVAVRETLLQLWTPDAVRGRVNAVNSVFVGASNELGEFRAGISATLLGVMPAVVFGGVGTIVVAGLWAFMFPDLRKARRLDRPAVAGVAG